MTTTTERPTRTELLALLTALAGASFDAGRCHPKARLAPGETSQRAEDAERAFLRIFEAVHGGEPTEHEIEQALTYVQTGTEIDRGRED